jgi:hypothetical protein
LSGGLLISRIGKCKFAPILNKFNFTTNPRSFRIESLEKVEENKNLDSATINIISLDVKKQKYRSREWNIDI